MRIIQPGTMRHFSNETTTSNHLLSLALSDPEILPQVATLFSAEHTPFSSLLARKGLTSSGLYANMENKNYKVIGNRKVQWAVKGMDERKGRIMSATYSNADKPGYGGGIIELHVDINWFSPYDVLELSDNRTYLHVVDDKLPEKDDSGYYIYKTRMARDNKEAYVNPALLARNKEIGWSHTAFYEMSETGYEKYTFHDAATTHMTIQRMKWSISGTAAQMNTKKYWIEHNGQMAWTTEQEMQMLKRWAMARERQLLFGKSTVGENDEVLVSDMKGRELMAGDGLIYSGSGALKFPYHILNEKYVNSVLKNLQLHADGDGKFTVAAIVGQEWMTQFQDMCARKKVSSGEDRGVVDGSGSNKGINNTYKFYEWNGVRLMPIWYKYFDSPARPGDITPEGWVRESQRAIFVSLGQADTGNNNVELLTLGNRQFRKGTIGGIDVGGDEMKSSVDGQHTHVLSETGIASMSLYGVAEMYRPYGVN